MATPTSRLENNHIRAASFSSYLNGTDELFVPKLAREPCPEPSPKKKADDGEIDVFDAEKYFNGGMDHTGNIHKYCATKKEVKSDEEYTTIPPLKEPLSIGSETSGNSQFARNNSTPRKANKTKRNIFFTSLGCKCVCFDTDSTVIDQYRGKTKINTDIEKWPSKLRSASPKTGNESDLSDASSDLFEIRILAPATTGYTPSEASIEWSVITASAADFSAMSDFEPSSSIAKNRSKMSRRELSRRHPSGLMGCNSNKALSVMGDAYR